MRTVFLSFAATLSSLTVAAQQPNLSWYTAEGMDYYEVRGCKPGATAEFYSSDNGGRLVASETVGATGCLAYIGSEDFRPAMVLVDGMQGANFVSHTGAKEFSVATPTSSGTGNITRVSWEAATTECDISFQLLRSSDEVNWQIATSMEAAPDQVAKLYSFCEPWDGNTCFYKLAVVSKSKGLRYVSRQVILSGNSSIMVFPTCVSNELSIIIPAINSTDYIITAADGKVVMKGSLLERQNTLSLCNLAAGHYVIAVHAGIEKKIVKLVKL